MSTSSSFPRNLSKKCFFFAAESASNAAARIFITLAGTRPGMVAAGVFSRGEKGKTWKAARGRDSRNR